MRNTATEPGDTQAQASHRRHNVILIAAAIALLAKVVIALTTYGTNDVYTYQRFGVWSGYFGAELYKIAPDLNHPPSMLHFLRFLDRTAQVTHIPFSFVLRFCGIAADFGAALLLCRIFASRLACRSTFIAILLIAIAPTSIIVSGFHGNTDPLMIFLILFSAWLATDKEYVLAGGLVFGLAFCIKIMPIMLVPVFFFAIPGFRKPLLFFGAALALVVVAWSPYAFQEPVAVAHQVFGYKSSYGLWGPSWIFREMANAWPATGFLNRAFSRYGSPVVMLAILSLTIRMRCLPKRPTIYTQLGMVFFLFFSITSGFATQYVVWLTPWLAELGMIPVAGFFLTASVFLLVVYNYWNLGMPWYLAIAYPWSPHQYFQVICWISVVILATVAWHRIRRANALPDGTLSRCIDWITALLPRYAFPMSAAAAVGTSVLLLYPAWVHMKRDTFAFRPTYGPDDVFYEQADEYRNLATELYRHGRSREAEEINDQASSMVNRGAAISAEIIRRIPARADFRTPEEYVDASLEDYNRGDYEKCVVDATESLKLRPGMPAAWNNISVCNSQLGNWDAAVVGAIEALHIEPESDVVKANLDWAMSEQKKASGR